MSANDSTFAVEYRSIPGFNGYVAGSDGTIWTCKQLSKGCQYVIGERRRELSYVKSKDGYLSVGVCNDGKLFRKKVAHLVLFAFCGPRPSESHQCRHLNGNSLDNRIDNLAWGTPLENARDQYVHGTRIRGERAAKAKLTEAEVLEIRELRHSGLSHRELAERFGVGKSTIRPLLTGKTWRTVPNALKAGEVASLNRQSVIRANAVLNEQQVRDIRIAHKTHLASLPSGRKYADKGFLTELASRYGVSKPTLQAIISRRMWKGVA